MLNAPIHVDEGIVRLNHGSGTQCGLHKARSACACATSTAARAAGSRARRSRTESANASPWSSLDHASVDPSEGCTSLCAQNICICNGQVIARNREVEIVLKRKINRIL